MGHWNSLKKTNWVTENLSKWYWNRWHLHLLLLSLSVCLSGCPSCCLHACLLAYLSMIAWLMMIIASPSMVYLTNFCMKMPLWRHCIIVIEFHFVYYWTSLSKQKWVSLSLSFVFVCLCRHLPIMCTSWLSYPHMNWNLRIEKWQFVAGIWLPAEHF